MTWGSSSKGVGRAERPNRTGKQSRNQKQEEAANTLKTGGKGWRCYKAQKPGLPGTCESWDHTGYTAMAKDTLEAERWGEIP